LHKTYYSITGILHINVKEEFLYKFCIKIVNLSRKSKYSKSYCRKCSYFW